MKTMFKYKFLMVSALATALFTGYSCDDNDSYVSSSSKPTMAQIIRQDGDLSQFIQVVDACGSHCLDSLFNQDRVYTAWIPVNNTFNGDSLIEECVANNHREEVFTSFIKHHITNYRHLPNESYDDDNKVLMLNGKYASFTGNAIDGFYFEGKKIEETNNTAKNGVIHKISTPAKYFPSIWEILKSITSIESFWKYCNRYTKREIDHGASIPGGYKDQQQIYSDTVYYEANSLLNSRKFASIDNEDSTYLFFVPKSEVWDEITNDAMKYFQYDRAKFTEAQLEELDSITEHRGKREYMEYLTYSLNQQKFGEDVEKSFENLPDSLVPVNRDYNGQKFDKNMLMSSVIESYTTSNGRVYVLDKMPFTPYDLWYDTLSVESEEHNGSYFSNIRRVKDNQGNYFNSNTDLNVARVSISRKDQDPEMSGRLSANAYLNIVQKGTAQTGTTTMFVKNTLAAKYNIALVVVPDCFSKNDSILDVDPAKDTASKKRWENGHRLKLRIGRNLATSDKDDDIVLYDSDTDHLNFNVPTAGIDTIWLKADGNDYVKNKANGERFVLDLDYCESFNGLSTKTIEPEDYTLDIELQLIFSTKKGITTTNYMPYLNLDAILLVPVTEDSESDETTTQSHQ